MGNITRGIPLNLDGDYTGSFLALLNPYSVLLGLTVVALFAMHGAIYLVLKTEGTLQTEIREWVPRLIGIFLALFILFNVATFFECPNLVTVMKSRPIGFVVLVLDIAVALSIPRIIRSGNEFGAFLASCLTMVLLMAVLGISYFPNLVISHPDVANSLTIYTVASSPKTLANMIVIAVIGLVYTTSIYWIFRGKTKIGHVGY